MKPPAYKVYWDAAALSQLEAILAYLTKRSAIAPRLVKAAIFNRIEEIRLMPFQAAPDELRRPKSELFRAVVVFSYRITYQLLPEAHEIRILRVRHTSREPMAY